MSYGDIGTREDNCGVECNKRFGFHEIGIFEAVIKPEDLKNQRILISPLNWGMGHVARCIGLIHQLQKQGNSILVACDNQQKIVFQEYFDDLEFIQHRGYPFYFGGRGKFGADLFRVRKALVARLNEERAEVFRYVDEHRIDVVLSDHRYGFISKKVPSIFITHQVNLPVKWYEKIANAWHRRLMKQFEFTWVMDDEKSSLAGKLSENCPPNGCYIGHYSRFSLYSDEFDKKLNSVLIASGPMIYAEQLIELILKDDSLRSNLVVVHAPSLKVPENIASVSGSWKERDSAIRSAQHIISRSGYSTLMDLQILGVSGAFIPTKGQAEQEYLAQRFSK